MSEIIVDVIDEVDGLDSGFDQPYVFDNGDPLDLDQQIDDRLTQLDNPNVGADTKPEPIDARFDDVLQVLADHTNPEQHKEVYSSSEHGHALYLSKDPENPDMFSGKGEGRISMNEMFQNQSDPNSAESMEQQARYAEVIKGLYTEGYAVTAEYYDAHYGNKIIDIYHANEKGQVEVITVLVSPEPVDALDETNKDLITLDLEGNDDDEQSAQGAGTGDEATSGSWLAQLRMTHAAEVEIGQKKDEGRKDSAPAEINLDLNVVLAMAKVAAAPEVANKAVGDFHEAAGVILQTVGAPIGATETNRAAAEADPVVHDTGISVPDINVGVRIMESGINIVLTDAAPAESAATESSITDTNAHAEFKTVESNGATLAVSAFETTDAEISNGEPPIVSTVVDLIAVDGQQPEAIQIQVVEISLPVDEVLSEKVIVRATEGITERVPGRIVEQKSYANFGENKKTELTANQTIAEHAPAHSNFEVLKSQQAIILEMIQPEAIATPVPVSMNTEVKQAAPTTLRQVVTLKEAIQAPERSVINNDAATEQLTGLRNTESTGIDIVFDNATRVEPANNNIDSAKIVTTRPAVLTRPLKAVEPSIITQERIIKERSANITGITITEPMATDSKKSEPVYSKNIERTIPTAERPSNVIDFASRKSAILEKGMVKELVSKSNAAAASTQPDNSNDKMVAKNSAGIELALAA